MRVGARPSTGREPGANATIEPSLTFAGVLYLTAIPEIVRRGVSPSAASIVKVSVVSLIMVGS
jgi:hypothetical protein